MILNDKVYDALKWTTTIVLPAVGTLYFALASIWGFPFGEQVVGTITALVAFFGVVLKISSTQYEGSGDIALDKSDPENETYTLALGVPISELTGRKTVNLKVVETDQTNVEKTN